MSSADAARGEEPVPIIMGPLNSEESYQVLEIADADKGDVDKVKKAYRRLCLLWHPDKNKDKVDEATARFTQITAAYHTLTTNNFDYARWAKTYTIPAMQTLDDVLKMALSGRDPFEIEAMLRARGDYRPHGNFGVDVHVPWAAGERPDPTLFDQGQSAYRTTQAIGEARKQMELMWNDNKIAGSSKERPWERVGGTGYDGANFKDGPLLLDERADEDLRPDLSADSPEASKAAEELNDKGVAAFEEKKYRRAFDLYTECLRLAPDKVPYLGNRAAAGLKIPGRESRVVEDCERATALDPSYVRGYVRLGQALLALGDKGDVGDAPTLRRAKRALEKALELDPSNATAMKCAKEVGMSIQLHCDSDEDED